MSNSSIWPIDRTFSGAITLDQKGPGNDGNEEVLCFPKTPDELVSYPGPSLEVGVLPLCRRAVGVFYKPSWQGSKKLDEKENMNIDMVCCFFLGYDILVIVKVLKTSTLFPLKIFQILQKMAEALRNLFYPDLTSVSFYIIMMKTKIFIHINKQMQQPTTKEIQ